MSENSLNPEHKESRVQTLALVYFNGYRNLLNWQLAVAMAEEAQKFYEAGGRRESTNARFRGATLQ